MLRSPITTLLLAVALAACGSTTPTQPRCQASNCSGCCASDTECLTGSKETAAACGTGLAGGTCHACSSGQTCSATLNKCVTVAVDSGTPPEDAGACGLKGQPCCEGGIACDTALTCARGYCSVPQSDAGCGALGQSCCAGSCYLPNSCQGNVCAAATDSGVTDAGIRLKVTGQACGNGVECFDGTCLTTGFPGGVCTKACTTSADCLAGSQCATNPTGSGPAKVCLAQCTSPGKAPGGCRTSYACERNAGTSGVPVCTPTCTATTGSCAGSTCDPGTGLCCGGNAQTCCGGITCQTGNCGTDGYCSPTNCGGLGQDCCTGGACNGQMVCGAGTKCVSCGGVGQACCASNVCSNSTCVSGSCVVCGAAGQACCDGSVCGSGATCLGGSCTTCGGVNQPCCGGDTCSGGAICAAGTCTVIGSACLNGGTQCQGKLCLQDPNNQQYTGGYCTVDCTAGNSTCPLGSTCSPVVNTAGTFCYSDCTWDGGAGGCRSGYVCDNVLGAVVCVSACTLSQQCPSRWCENGFCCGQRGFKCCSGNTCPVSGSCNASTGYCN